MKQFVFYAAFATVVACTPTQAAGIIVGNTPAISCAKAAIAERPDADRSIAARLDSLADCDAALREKLAQSDRAATLVNRGIIEAAMGRSDAAIADYDSALARDPRLADAYINRGSVLLRDGRLGEARADFDRAIALRADSAVAYFNRGMANEKMGDLTAAYRDYKQAHNLSPDFRPASLELARFQVRPREVAVSH